MPITYQYEPDTKIVRTTATGVITTQEMVEYVSSVVEDPEVERGFIEVTDFESITDFVLTYSELTPFPALWGQYMQKGCRASLIYAPTDLGYGTLRMAKTFITLEHELAEDLFVVYRKKEDLENRLKELLTD
jgi:hypothetical protein